jgi:AcrR family transcriptional regulator
MSPRPYKLGQRQAATQQTRARIIDATREMLMSSDGFSSFSIDGVARQADVARMTVYHQFGSKIGLLEALCDTLAASGGMEQIAVAFQQADPRDTLDQYLLVFSRFWDADRLVTRRLRALAALDPDFEHVIWARDERRRQGVGTILHRLQERKVVSANIAFDDVVDMLFTLSSFESFDTLAGPRRSAEEVAPLVIELVHTVLQFKPH